VNPLYDLPMARWSNTQERIETRIERGDGCWSWTGALDTSGYGRVFMGGKQMSVHRLMYEWHCGPIPEGYEIDHTCHTDACPGGVCEHRRCCNPEHLDAVPKAVNVARGQGHASSARRAARRTHCPSGHPYDSQNTLVTPDGSRKCRTCHRDRERARRQRL